MFNYKVFVDENNTAKWEEISLFRNNPEKYYIYTTNCTTGGAFFNNINLKKRKFDGIVSVYRNENKDIEIITPKNKVHPKLFINLLFENNNYIHCVNKWLIFLLSHNIGKRHLIIPENIFIKSQNFMHYNNYTLDQY